MNKEELKEKISEISNSEFPLIDFFNDIDWLDDKRFNIEKAYEDIEKIYNVFAYYKDKVKRLETENQELIRTQNVILLNAKDYIIENMKLEKKYQKLEETFRKRAELCSEFGEYLRQYEKALDFLIGKFKLELKGNRLYFLYNNQYFELDKDIEKIIKEVFGYE